MPPSLPQSHPRVIIHASSGVAQIQTSNQTVNAFLGGARPAWMGGTVENTIHVSTSTESTVNPSKAPVVPSTVRAKRGRPRRNPLSCESNPTVQPTEQLENAEAQMQRNTILPSPAPTDEPSPVVPAQQESPKQTVCEHVEVQAPADVVANLENCDSVQEGIIEVAASENTMETGSASARSIHGQDGTAATTNGPSPTESQATDGNRREMNLSRAPVPPTNQPVVRPQQSHETQVVNSPVQATRRAPGPPPGTSEPPAKRPRIAAPNQAVHRGPPELGIPRWEETLDRRIATYTSAGSLEDYCEKPRYRCLQDALRNKDVFYVALHQVNCLWSVQRPYIHAVLGEHVSLANINKSFEILQCVLRPNNYISSDHLRWFSEFPAPLPELINKVQAYQYALSDVVQFLAHLSQNWERVIEDVKRRKYPLITAELTGPLRCPSPMFQTMLFTVSRRHLAIEDGPLAVQLSSLFHQNQTFETTHILTGKVAEPLITQSRNEVMARSAEIVRQAHNASSRRSMFTDSLFLGQSLNWRIGSAGSGVIVVSAPQPRRTSSHSQPGSNPANAEGLPTRVNQQMPSPLMTYPLPARPQINNRIASSPTIPTYERPHPLPMRAPRQKPGQQPQFARQQTSMMQYQAQPGFSGQRPSPLTHPSQMQMHVLQQPPSVPSNGIVLEGQRRASFVQFPSQVIPVARNGLSSPGLVYSRDHLDPNLPQNNPSVRTNPPLNPQQWAGAGATGLQYPPGLQVASPTVHHNYGPQQQRQHLGPALAYTRIPPNTYPCSSHDLASVAMGLHQAGIRSPRREPLTPTSSQFYQYIKELPVPPVEMVPRTGLRHFMFDVPSDYMPKLARKFDGRGFSDLPYAPYSEGSLRYRLRLCIRPMRETEMTESLWVLSPSHWPEHIMIEFNEKHMELQRKQHHHRDLPLELTNFIKSGGNMARISLPAIPINKKVGAKYFLGVDVVEIRSHQSILEDVHKRQHVTEEETRQELRRRLKPGDSDDMIIENQTLSVSLADPFSFRIFQVPVRGKNCRHLECFDLETWLTTRPCKPQQKAGGRKDTKEPCKVDVWKCPICDLDARPISLRIDDFFVQVRKELSEKNNLGTKVITVNADGKWSPVEEPDDSEDETPGPNNRPVSVQRNPKVVSAPEVIEIFDDD